MVVSQLISSCNIKSCLQNDVHLICPKCTLKLSKTCSHYRVAFIINLKEKKDIRKCDSKVLKTFSYLLFVDALNAKQIIKSPKQSLGDLLFLLRFFFLLLLLLLFFSFSFSFFPQTVNLSTADLRNYRTEFHETLWSYRYMFFLVDPKVFRFVVKGSKPYFGGFKGWGLL